MSSDEAKRSFLKFSACAEPNLISNLDNLVTPSTNFAISSPNSFFIKSNETSLSSTTS